MTRRFTPPTCTLEIEPTGSALSPWQKRKALKNIQFQLSFDDPRLNESEQFTIQGDRTQLEQLYQAVTNYLQNFLQQTSSEQLVASTPDGKTQEPTQPYLQPQGLVAHELFLGSLENSKSGKKINLSTTQLFDLVTALEDYQSEVAITANPNSTQRKKLPVWTTIVASLLVLAGLATISFNLYNRSSRLQTASNEPESATNEPTAEIEEKADVIPPQVTKLPEKRETPRQTETPLSSTEKLPPPPAVDLPKPPPTNVPDFSKYPLPKPEEAPKIEPKIAIDPLPTQPSPSPSSSSQSEIAINTPQENIDIPDVPPLSPSLLPTEADIGDDSDVVENDTEQEQPLTINETEIAQAEDNTQPEQSLTLESEASDSATRLKEIQQYFQQRWQPPEQLKQTIEYRLVINDDGSVLRIIPIGKASEIFVDRTNIPLMGESFVSSSATKGNQTIRLLLSPDGSVKTFLESK